MENGVGVVVAEWNFPEALKALAANYGWCGQETFAQLVKMYDGYRFHADATPVFNPVSLGSCLSSGEFGEYWFETGTPTFLLKLLQSVVSTPETRKVWPHDFRVVLTLKVDDNKLNETFTCENTGKEPSPTPAKPNG